MFVPVYLNKHQSNDNVLTIHEGGHDGEQVGKLFFAPSEDRFGITFKGVTTTIARPDDPIEVTVFVMTVLMREGYYIDGANPLE